MPVSIKNKTPDSAEIWVYEDIGASFFGDGVTARSFAADLKGLGAVKNLTVRISSYGGDVFDGLAIYRQLADHPAHVSVKVDGIAASIASVIAMAGDEITISENGFLMIHDAWAVASGNAADMRSVADRLETVSSSLADVYAARSGRPREVFVDAMKKETWYNAREAVAAGLATNIAENVAIAAKYQPERYKFRHVPNVLLPTEQALKPLSSARARLDYQRGRLAAPQINRADKPVQRR